MVNQEVFMSPLSLSQHRNRRSSRRVMSKGATSVKQGLSAEEVRAALLRAAYMLHATRVVGWREEKPLPKKG